MRVSTKMSWVAFVVAFAGAATPTFADGSYYQPAPDGGYYEPAPGGVYVDPMPTAGIYLEPVPMYGGYGYYRPPARTLGDERERYTNEYMGGGEGDYYQGITHPAPVP